MGSDKPAGAVKIRRPQPSRLRSDASRASAQTIQVGVAAEPPLLLTMAEGLIAAHKAAKIDGDDYTLDLIETALRQVGRRLAQEVRR